jgi:hypothetical protein
MPCVRYSRNGMVVYSIQYSIRKVTCVALYVALWCTLKSHSYCTGTTVVLCRSVGEVQSEEYICIVAGGAERSSEVLCVA